MEKELRSVFSAALARRLIGLEYVVKDIKPNPNNHDRTIFYFEDTKDLDRIITRYTKK